MRRQRLSLEEKYHLIMECRSSGLSGKDWCEGKGIPQSTFYAWLKKIKDCGDELPKMHKAFTSVNPKQDVVRLSLPSSAKNPSLDAPVRIADVCREPTRSTIMIEIDGIKIHVTNGVEPMMLAQTLKIIRGTLC